MGKKKTVVKDVALHVMANLPDERHYQMLQMFYRGAHNNTIGLMEARDKDTSDIHTLIVGLTMKEDGSVADAFPLARVFGANDTANYEAPDGKGGWLDRPAPTV